MAHRWVWMNEIQNGTLRRVGSACIGCGYRAYGWGGMIGPCIAVQT
jgi:hypothetical protein